MGKKNNTEKFIQTESTDVGEPIQTKSIDGWNPISMKSPYVRKSIHRELTNGEKSIHTDSANGGKSIQTKSTNTDKLIQTKSTYVRKSTQTQSTNMDSLIQTKSTNMEKFNPNENQIKKETINMEKSNTTNSSGIYTATRPPRNKLATILAVWLFAFVALFAVAYVNAPAPFNGARNATVSAEYSGGTGTETDPYLLSTTADFESLATTVNAGTTYSGSYFKMTADVTLPSTWGTIGGSGTVFGGILDGMGHSIKLNETKEGVFSYVNGQIRNIRMTGSLKSEVGGYDGSVGSLAGALGGENALIESCLSEVDVSVTGEMPTVGYSVGGLIGTTDVGGIVKNCYNLGNVTSSVTGTSDSGCYVAGLGTGAQFFNCYNIGKVVEQTCTTYLLKVGGVLVDRTNCFSVGTSDSSNSDSHYYVVDSTNTDFKSLATYQGTSTYTWDSAYPWDFDNVWTFVDGENDGYPVLRAFYKTYYTVSFDVETNGVTNGIGGTTDATPVQVESGTTFTIADQTATPSKSGWSFVGWSLTPNSTTTVTTIENITENKTLYAVWEHETCWVKFYQVGSQTASDYLYNLYNNETSVTIKAPDLTAVEGYTGVGWGTADSVKQPEFAGGANVTLTESNTRQTYYAMLKTSVVVSYNGNNGTGETPSRTKELYIRADGTSDYAITVTPYFALAINEFTRDGYTFTKWAKDSASGTQYDMGTTIYLTSDTTFYAVWEKNTYITTFNIAFTNIDSGRNNIIVYLLRENSDGGYDEFYTYYLNKSDTFTLELTKNVEYEVLVSKPYAWTLNISGSNVTDGTFSNNTYTFTTLSDLGTISITTTGGSTINNFICI